MSNVLITGGTGLLGGAIVRGFLEKGWQVTFTTTKMENAERLKEDLRSKGNVVDKPSFRVVKFESESDVSTFLKASNDSDYTHLVNNARSLDGLRVDSNGHTSSEAFSAEFFMAATVPYLLAVGMERSLQNVINISSMYGIVAPNRALYLDAYQSSPIQYGVAKAAQNQLTKELSVRFGRQGVRVNSVSFGGVEGRADEDFKKRYEALCPTGRMLKIDDVFGPVWFLASKDSEGMTGHNVVVDGGWSVW